MMLKLPALAVFVALAIPALASANTWSPCQTITAVSNYTAYSKSVFLVLSPGIPSCNSDAPGAAVFRVGQMGVTDDSLKGYLATAMTAFAMGKRVMIYYDNGTSACFSSVIAVGGFSAQCS